MSDQRPAGELCGRLHGDLRDDCKNLCRVISGVTVMRMVVKTGYCCQVSRDESLSFSQTFLTFSTVLNIILFVHFRLDIFLYI